MDVLAPVPVATGVWGSIDQAQANAAFAQHQDMVPHTLADCLPVPMAQQLSQEAC